MNINEIINRIRQSEGLHTKKEIAALFCISPQDFRQREKRGTLLPLIVKWAMQKNLSLDWLLSGYTGGETEQYLGENAAAEYRISSDIFPQNTKKYRESGSEGMQLLRQIMSSGDEAVIQMTLEQLRVIARFIHGRENE